MPILTPAEEGMDAATIKLLTVEKCAAVMEGRAKSLDEMFLRTKLPEYTIRAQDARDAADEIRDLVLQNAESE